jgi:hypothetical protein
VNVLAKDLQLRARVLLAPVTLVPGLGGILVLEHGLVDLADLGLVSALRMITSDEPPGGAPV